MSTIDMQPAAEGHDVSAPVVLSLNVEGAQGYLNPNNDILEQLYGQPLRRVDAYFDYDDVFRSRAKDHIFKLLQEYPDVSLNEMQARINDMTFLHVRVLRRLVEAGVTNFEHVRIVLINSDIVFTGGNPSSQSGDQSILREALEPEFKNAWFFETNQYRGHWSTPKRLWYTPNCPNCGNLMKAAGDNWACENCGTAKID